MRLRPLPLLMLALAATGLFRGLQVVADMPAAGLPFLDGLVLSPAAAAGPPAKAPEPPAAELPAVVADCGPQPEEMLQAITDERAQLELQKQALAQRASELGITGEKLAIEQQRLTELKQEIEALFARAEKAQSDDVGRLVALYSNMKPKEAAGIMNDLDIEVTVLVLGTMPERDAAPILANLDPVRARAISRIILERSKLPGDQRLDNLKF